ncbi:hypothetical protein HDV00_000073 [Rhizophlyctis rosea]|nr:hypothetical protein HDV00_000073 [Rhizophlyctis rosea]
MSNTSKYSSYTASTALLNDIESRTSSQAEDRVAALVKAYAQKKGGEGREESSIYSRGSSVGLGATGRAPSALGMRENGLATVRESPRYNDPNSSDNEISHPPPPRPKSVADIVNRFEATADERYRSVPTPTVPPPMPYQYRQYARRRSSAADDRLALSQSHSLPTAPYMMRSGSRGSTIPDPSSDILYPGMRSRTPTSALLIPSPPPTRMVSPSPSVSMSMYGDAASVEVGREIAEMRRTVEDLKLQFLELKDRGDKEVGVGGRGGVNGREEFSPARSTSGYQHPDDRKPVPNPSPLPPAPLSRRSIPPPVPRDSKPSLPYPRSTTHTPGTPYATATAPSSSPPRIQPLAASSEKPPPAAPLPLTSTTMKADLTNLARQLRHVLSVTADINEMVTMSQGEGISPAGCRVLGRLGEVQLGMLRGMCGVVEGLERGVGGEGRL